MTEQKWTPGPWYIDGGYITSEALHDMDFVVNHVYGPEANAHLIAAAPELYEALERLMVECVLDGKENEAGYDCWIYQAKSALAKARGEA